MRVVSIDRVQETICLAGKVAWQISPHIRNDRVGGCLLFDWRVGIGWWAGISCSLLGGCLLGIVGRLFCLGLLELLGLGRRVRAIRGCRPGRIGVVVFIAR
jgi:hypothetical protein